VRRNQQGNPRDRWRQTLLAQERGRRRNERKGRIYNSGKWRPEHRPIVNPRFLVKGKGRGTLRVKLPEKLDFTEPEDRDAALSLVANIKKSALYERHKRIVLDFSAVKYVSVDVALILLAEIQRCRTYCTGKTYLTGTYPKEHEVSSLLNEIGFFDALGVKDPKLPATYSSRTYLRIERENKTLAPVVDNLLDCFSKEVNFDLEDRKRLHVALIECMDNVFQHAYAGDSQDPHLYKEWWMAGYADHKEGLVSFVFYDQGAGIPKTIKSRESARVKDFLRSWSDGKWIERAIRKPISRHDSRRRGHGLEKLKKFLDRTDMSGTLRVMANCGEVVLVAGKLPTLSEFSIPLEGSLIIWTLKPLQVR
jgi:hypothetical protein